MEPKLLAKDDDAWGVFDDDEDGDMPPLATEEPAPTLQQSSTPMAQAWEIFDGSDEDDDDEAGPPPPLMSGNQDSTQGRAAKPPISSMTSAPTKLARDEVDLRTILRGFVEEHIHQTCSDFQDVNQPALAGPSSILAFISHKKSHNGDDGDDTMLTRARRRLVLATILVVSCSAAAAITFFFAPLWGLMLLGVPIFMGVYLCITAFTGDPEMGGWPSLRRKKNELGEKDAPLDQNQPQPPTEAPLPV
ncbi:uncharacterized protein ACA1_261990 [Acanthamoeba castellanii str. Neff]|uniref:Transmembrane protein n=1 Tax=Acanthamoeba castellanii (strain ATCC 30010 / Neff) TaxID=1257118 RepID=L8H420_ACACF|nr:uncharacterized protein ACA1_261990 [Acanthamoeba castellanii str. Neff]ELR19181.1 hypothetical protein ACA1_261990 [Acanthamoeba castellanii str. Neff]